MVEKIIPQEPWTILLKLPKNELTGLVAGYVEYTSKFKFIYMAIIVFMALVFGYNVFFGGKSYTYATAKNIENTFTIINCIFLVCFLVVAGVVISKLIKLKKSVNQCATKYRLDEKEVREEFDSFVKTTIGGTGLR